MRIQSLILGAAASVLVVALGAIASIAGYLSKAHGDGAGQRAVPVAVAARPLDKGCPDCGMVVAVKPIELKSRTIPAARQYQIRVRMSDGSVKTLVSRTLPGWKAGDRVRIQNGRVAG
jgi:hypothetical protein